MEPAFPPPRCHFTLLVKIRLSSDCLFIYSNSSFMQTCAPLLPPPTPPPPGDQADVCLRCVSRQSQMPSADLHPLRLRKKKKKRKEKRRNPVVPECHMITVTNLFLRILHRTYLLTRGGRKKNKNLRFLFFTISIYFLNIYEYIYTYINTHI